jgi:hypothetical protein
VRTQRRAIVIGAGFNGGGERGIDASDKANAALVGASTAPWSVLQFGGAIAVTLAVSR